MSTAQLYDEVVRARLRHALLLERWMVRLLGAVKSGKEDAVGQYEWCMQAAKALATKDLLALGKSLAVVEEGDFDGFDDN